MSRLAGIRGRVRGSALLAITSVMLFTMQFSRYVFPPLFDTFQTTFGVSNARTGVLFTALLVAYALMQFPSGYLADSFGKIRVIVAGGVVFGAASLVVAAAPTFLVLAIAAVLVGVGAGSQKTVAITLVSEVHPEMKGTALAVMSAIAKLGASAAPLVVVAAVALDVHWRGIFVGIAAVSLVLGYVYLTGGVREYRRRSRTARRDVAANGSSAPGESAHRQYVSVFANRSLAIFMVALAIQSFSWHGVTSFLPLFLADGKGFETGVAGAIYSVFFALTVVQIPAGYASDYLSRTGIMAVLFGLMGVSVGGLIVSNGLVGIGLASVTLAIGFHGFRPVRDSYLMDLLPPAVEGGTLGIIRTMTSLIGATAPMIVGYVADAASFTHAFVLITAALVAATVIAVLLHRGARPAQGSTGSST